MNCFGLSRFFFCCAFTRSHEYLMYYHYKSKQRFSTDIFQNYYLHSLSGGPLKKLMDSPRISLALNSTIVQCIVKLNKTWIFFRDFCFLKFFGFVFLHIFFGFFDLLNCA